jgi:hypothetical protein
LGIRYASLEAKNGRVMVLFRSFSTRFS